MGNYIVVVKNEPDPIGVVWMNLNERIWVGMFAHIDILWQITFFTPTCLAFYPFRQPPSSKNQRWGNVSLRLNQCITRIGRTLWRTNIKIPRFTFCLRPIDQVVADVLRNNGIILTLDWYECLWLHTRRVNPYPQWNDYGRSSCQINTDRKIFFWHAEVTLPNFEVLLSNHKKYS